MGQPERSLFDSPSWHTEIDKLRIWYASTQSFAPPATLSNAGTNSSTSVVKNDFVKKSGHQRPMLEVQNLSVNIFFDFIGEVHALRVVS
jgi:hypothetical protein